MYIKITVVMESRELYLYFFIHRCEHKGDNKLYTIT